MAAGGGEENAPINAPHLPLVVRFCFLVEHQQNNPSYHETISLCPFPNTPSIAQTARHPRWVASSPSGGGGGGAVAGDFARRLPNLGRSWRVLGN